jgi:nudix-type nucleoside diphosphatase (YffH/AdpP family)
MSITDRVRIEETTVLSAQWAVLTKTRFAFRRSDGEWQVLVRESYDRGNAATILLYDRMRRTIVLTRQFRYPAYVNGYDDLLIETPAGLLDAMEPEARIRAETEEETGYRIGRIEKVFEAFMSPGSVTERLFFYTGEYQPSDRTSAGGGHAGEGEDIETLEVTIDEALTMIADGRIVDAKTIMLIQHAALRIFRS